MTIRQEFGKVAVLLGGRAGLGGAQHRCGQAKRPPVRRYDEGSGDESAA